MKKIDKTDDSYYKGNELLKEIYTVKEKTPEQIQNEKDMKELFGYEAPPIMEGYFDKK